MCTQVLAPTVNDKVRTFILRDSRNTGTHTATSLYDAVCSLCARSEFVGKVGQGSGGVRFYRGNSPEPCCDALVSELDAIGKPSSLANQILAFWPHMYSAERLRRPTGYVKSLLTCPIRESCELHNKRRESKEVTLSMFGYRSMIVPRSDLVVSFDVW